MKKEIKNPITKTKYIIHKKKNGLNGIMKLDYKKMLKDINKLVQTDFCFEMDMKRLPDSDKYTQEEAQEMADLIGNVYSISHCTTCESCNKEYRI